MMLLLPPTPPILRVLPFLVSPKDTKEYIRQLIREKDEARQNYS